MELLNLTLRLKTRFALTTFALLTACVPSLDSNESTVSEPRVLAIQADPAEASPVENKKVTYRALVVDADGNTTIGDLDWFYCVAQKPLAELGPISRACLNGNRGKLKEIGKGAVASGSLPTDACALFGPNPPPPEPDQPPGRPVDPDVTGGYKQPVMLNFNAGSGDEVLLYEQRIACTLSSASQKLSAEFAARYQRNQNPVVSQIKIERENGTTLTIGEEDETLAVKRGETVRVHAIWPECPVSTRCGDGVCGLDEGTASCPNDCSGPKGCGGPEAYLRFNTETREIEVRRENLRAAWYATAGTYEEERTGVADDDGAKDTSNTWTAPSKASDVTLWIVLRDARGGVGFRALRITVR